MKLSKYLFIILFLAAFQVKAQPAQFDTKKLDYNFTILRDTVYKGLKNTGKPGIDSVEFIFYPNSVPSRKLFVTKTKRTSVSLISKGKHYDSLLVLNPWIKNFPISQYRVLSISNNSTSQQKIFYYSTGYNPTGDYAQYYLDKIAVFMEAKDEHGNWKEINTGDNLKIKNVASRRFMRANEQIILLIKPPEGDFATDIRFKLLINEPPDFHIEQYIYSNVLKGKIDKTLFKK